MTFLPIVERELRVAARRRGTYWLRFFTALAAFGLFLIMNSESGMPSSYRAIAAFHTMSVLMLIICLLSGVFSTADCLSSEKRQGTMGLLFLTDLRGYDVILGKLAAHTLAGFYGLLSMLPVLALPLMMGGVTPGEYWRMVLVLTGSMFLSLSIGMLISSMLRESRPAFLLTLLAVVALTLLVPLCASLLGLNPVMRGSGQWLFRLSPIDAYRCSLADFYTYGRGQNEFWLSLATLAGIALACLGGASFLLPFAWQEKSAGDSTRNRPGFWKRARFGSPVRRLAARLRLLEINPILWLTARDRLPLLLCLPVLLLGGFFWGWVYFKVAGLNGFAAFGLIQVMFTINCGMNLVMKFIIAGEASRRLNDDRQSGALELLLVTPTSVPAIISGQRRALLRQFGLPLGLCLAFLAATWVGYAKHKPPGLVDGGIFDTMMIGNMIVLVSDFLALCWVGMWDGLRARQHHRAMLRSIVKVLFVPWMMFILLQSLFVGSRGGPGTAQFMFTIWYSLAVANNLFWMFRARRGLLRYFRPLVAEVATGLSRPFFPRRRTAPAS